MSDNYAIQVSKLTKIYPPNLKAVDELDLTVRRGEIMALLGPNGAGKSTTIRVLSTLSGFDSGQATIAGIDVDSDPEQVRRTIGVVAQKTGVDHFLTGRENMTLQGHLYRMKKADIRARVDELADYFELKDSIDKPVMSYSGGMTRKLDIATALIHRPQILFLDEPTLGLDIRSRKILWRHIEELNQKFGLTILLTTHYLEEADNLSHRVAIINAGKIRIIGTPDELKNGIHGDSVVVSFDNVGQSEQAYAASLKAEGRARDAVWDGNNLHLYVDDGAGSVPQIMEQAARQQVKVKTLSLARPTLDDVFLKYTGTSMVDSGEEKAEEWWTQWAGKGGGGNWQKWAKKWGYEGDGDSEWQGNEWVDASGKPKGEWSETGTAAGGTEDKAAGAAAEAWQGNQWVDKGGRQQGEWGNSPDWQGNEWVDREGKPKQDWKAAKGSETGSKTGVQAGKKPDTGSWQGNQWVDKEGRQQGDWGDSPDWKGNEWVDQEGKPKADWNSPTAGTQDNASAGAEEKPKGEAWQGNQWVDKEGRQQGDWGNSSDWKGNEWVDQEGKPKADWNSPTAGTQDNASAGAEEKPKGEAWQGNQWVDKEGRQQGDWGNSSDWKGNEWVDQEGKPKQDWSKDSGKKGRS